VLLISFRMSVYKLFKKLQKNFDELFLEWWDNEQSIGFRWRSGSQPGNDS